MPGAVGCWWRVFVRADKRVELSHKHTKNNAMFFVYILASRPHGAIYVGSTGNLRQRVEQHRTGLANSHTKKYGIHTLVYFETHPTRVEALHRERRLKRYARLWKDDLIIASNPEWRDISDQIPL